MARNARQGNAQGPRDDARSGAFDSDRVLDMTIQSFLERIFRYARVAPPVYVVAYVYMDRLCQLNRGLRITLGNVHRLLVTSIMELQELLLRKGWGIKRDGAERLGGEFSLHDGIQASCERECFRELLQALGARSELWRRISNREVPEIDVRWRDEFKGQIREKKRTESASKSTLERRMRSNFGPANILLAPPIGESFRLKSGLYFFEKRSPKCGAYVG
ncbi:uncharacterized protein A4U43_C10F7780 [Asparagus officinalis]|uniref:Uncharacterized protein n=1 Tax=Asparagus officinalis TaxID=4686 RepID=A0A5P1E196_ASPOF|nr:uncharacterized protein A4U43_C10F7780 [Asparagus officinalis]